MKAGIEQPGWQDSFSTEETGSEELFDENQSIASEAISQLSTRSFKRHHDVKKLLVTIQRLKQENLSLRDALDSSNILDLATMKNKLRGATADLVRLRQTNGELKERIQVLEKKIFDMVTADRSKPENELPPDAVEPKPANLLSVKEKLKFLKRSQMAKEDAQTSEQSNSKVNNFSVKSERDPTDANSGDSSAHNHIPSDKNSIVTLQAPSSTGAISYKDYVTMYNKSRHFERLARSLERRMEFLQDENSKSNAKNENFINDKLSKHSKSIEFAESKDINESSAFDENVASEDLMDNVALISEKKSKDANTIRELAAEVKRLTALVSRSMIEEDESLAPGASLKEVSSVDFVDDNTTDSNNLASQKSILIVRGFSFLFVALAFLIGVLLVLVPLIIRHPELSLW